MKSKEREHAILRPSAAHRWFVCTPSAQFEEQFENKDSEFAAEGTLAHELARLYLLFQLDGIDEKEYAEEVDKLASSEFYCKEMIEYVTEYGDFVLSIGGDILVEHRFTITPERWKLPENWGTSDATNLVEFDGKTILTVTDLKYGAGVKVYARENKQAMCYAWGALNYFKEKGVHIDHVNINIYQPRIGGSPVNSWGISAEELEEWAETDLFDAAIAANSGEGEFIIGDHCQFCRARVYCKAFYNSFKLFGDDPHVLTEDQRQELLDKGDAMVKFINALRNEARDALLRGEKVKGYKLIKGRTTRKYTDPDLVADALHAEGLDFLDVYDVEVKALTTLEKILGKKRFNELLGEFIAPNEGLPQLAKCDDPRQSYGATASQVYEDQDDEK